METFKLWVASLNYASMIPQWEAKCIEVDVKTQKGLKYINSSLYKFSSLKKFEVENFCNQENLNTQQEMEKDREYLLKLYKLKIKIKG